MMALREFRSLVQISAMLLASLFIMLPSAFVAHAQGENVEIGLSNDTISITSSFDGTDIVIFGAIENADFDLIAKQRYDLAIVLDGPRQIIVSRQKGRSLGIWVNQKSLTFGNVPTSYSVATTRKIEEMADVEVLKTLQLGSYNINFTAEDESTDPETRKIFTEAILRNKARQALYLERIGGVEFLREGSALFKARIAIPANVPIGTHMVRAFLFKDKQFIESSFTQLEVKKIGFEQFTYNLAHTQSFIYGIIAVLVAMATGWLAGVVFRKD